jgi:addiction module HigA family antidote
MKRRLHPIIPGEILREEFLKPLGLSQNELARRLHVTPARISDLIHGRRAITADTAARLALLFRTSVGFWLNLQSQYDTRRAERDIMPALARRIRALAPHAA